MRGWYENPKTRGAPRAFTVAEDRVSTVLLTGFGGDAVYGEWLQLAAIGRIGNGRATDGFARNTQPQQQAEECLVRVEGRAAAPVVEVTGAARPSIERRAKAVARGCRRGRLHPRLIE